MKEKERRKKLILTLEEGMAEAKDIMNRQAEEIERLKEINQFLRDNITGNAEITLRNNIEDINNAKREEIMRFGNIVMNKIDDGEIVHSFGVASVMMEELEKLDEMRKGGVK